MLDKNQMKAIETKDKKTLVVAAPGSGKTTVILNRVRYLLETKKVYVGSIYVITFTKAAAMNMKERYNELFNTEKTPFFGTFHGLFYKILLRENFKINIINPSISNKIIKDVLGKYVEDYNDELVKTILNYISKVKTLGKAHCNTEIDISQDILEKCIEAYEAFKLNKDLQDFDDLGLMVLRLFKERMDVKKKYSELFKYILVDEFQDCDELQVEFLKLLNLNNDIFAVGDEDQCIYSFRGSRPQYMIDFDSNFNNGKKIYLDINYRSTENIVSLSKELIEKNKERNRKRIISNRAEKGKIKFIQPESENKQGDEICNLILQSGYNLNETAILYRTNMESRAIVDSCLKSKIKFNILDKGYNFFENFICRDILSYFAVSINIQDKDAFVKIINKPFRYISKENIEYIKRSYSNKDGFELLIEKSDCKDYQRKSLEDLKIKILSLNKFSLGTALQMILSDLGYYEYLKEYSSRNNIDFDQLEEVIEEFKSLIQEYRTITQLLIHVEKVKESLKTVNINGDGVTLSTVHGVKGMEFKNVFIINVVEEVMPHKASLDNNIEEERRVFYVAITRAIDNLYISVPKYLKNTPKVESRFIRECNLRKYIYEDLGVKVGRNIKHNKFGVGVVSNISENTISILFNDKDIRRFSLDILVNSKIIELI